MAFETASFSVLLIFHTFFWSFLGLCIASRITESDIYCLKSIKDSWEDPSKTLSSSWNFNNNTKGFICKFAGVECWHPDENRVLNLNLSDMGLKGQFPRGIVNCTSLVGLNLSYNHLTGSIPSDISRLFRFATTVDLSHNNFNGEIPSNLADCRYLNVLKLDNNQLSGNIPREFALLQRFKVFSVANNHLTGAVPVFKHDVFVVNYENNSGLCGGPLNSCEKDGTFFASFKDGFIVGYILAATSVTVVYLFYCVPWSKFKRSKKISNVHERGISFSRDLKKKENGGNQKLKLIYQDLLKKRSNEIPALLETMISRMSFTELCNATNYFSTENAIGAGKTGTMYKAKLPNGWFLAVKKLHNFELIKRNFASEVIILGRYKHINLVPLFGFCMVKEENFLVYQHISNGRLYDWLHCLKSDNEDARILEWPFRVKIALGIARGLYWLHHNLHVAHLKIGSECILLDKKFEPKISNFGGAKFMSRNRYRFSSDPSFMKKDVYDFGSLLFELITRKKFSEVMDFIQSTNKGRCSTKSSKLFTNPSIFYSAIDESLIMKGYDDEIFTLLTVACHCIQRFPNQRPSMLEVYNNISKIRARYCY